MRDPRRRSAVAALLCLTVTACAEEPPPNLIELPAQCPGVVAVERVWDAAFASDPTAARFAIQLLQPPAPDDRWFLVSQSGTVHIIPTEARDGEARLVLDLRDRLWTGHEEAGLRNLAFHPQHATNGRLFVLYDALVDDRHVNRLSEITLPDVGVTPQSERVLLEIAQPAPTHSVNHALFGPDGYLYLSSGDGGFFVGRKNGQDTSNLHGAILRLDVDAPDVPYGVPPDNPFADGGGAPELFAWGLRNPWRMAFHPTTGELWVGDVGEASREEVDRVVMGGNYGWPIMEGELCFDAATCSRDGLELPVVSYTHSEGRSITGGDFYGGRDLLDLDGSYVFADYIAGVVWRVTDPDGAEPGYERVVETGFHISHIARGHDGELYLVRYAADAQGGVYRLVPGPDGDGVCPPERLSQTGLLDPEDPWLPGPFVTPYALNAELWSDGAQKGRYIGLPRGTSAIVDAAGDLQFPEGTILIKHFARDDVLLETRLLVRDARGDWGGFSYAWDPEQRDATLLDSGLVRSLPGGRAWAYPSRTECLGCHTAVAGYALGPTAPQLQRGDQLDVLLATGVIAGDSPIEAAALPEPFGDAPLEDRAKAYLDANCAGCHQPGGTAQGELDLRYGTPLTAMGLCGLPPQVHDMWIAGALLFDPGAPENSILARRMANTQGFRMPPIGSREVDAAGVALIESWIASVDSCP